MTAASPRTGRSRVRQVETGEKKLATEVPNEARALIREVYQENKAMNAHKKKHDAARAALLGFMKDNKVSHYEVTTEIEGKKLNLEADVTTADKEYVDVAKLRTLVGEETFMKIASATKTAVTEFAGKEVLAQCTVVQKGAGNTNVSVGLVK